MWEIDFVETVIDLVHYRTEITSTHIGANVDATLEVFMFYDIRSRRDAHVGHLLQTHVTAPGRVDQ